MTFFFCTQLCCRWSENALDVNATAKHVSNRNDYESSKFFCKKKKMDRSAVIQVYLIPNEPEASFSPIVDYSDEKTKISTSTKQVCLFW